MPDRMEDKEKTKLDDEDIVDVIKKRPEKAELDADGVVEQDKDRAVLDHEDIFQESSRDKGERTERRQEAAPSPEKALAEETGPKPERFAALLEALKRLSLLKKASVLGGAVVLTLLGWLCISFFILTPPETVRQEFVSTGAPEGQNTEPEIKDFELESFLIPLDEAQDGVSFVNLKIVIDFREANRNDFIRDTKAIRTSLFRMLRQKKSQDFVDFACREHLKQEVQALINKVLKKNAVTGIDFQDIKII